MGLQDVHAWLTRGEADGGLHMVTPFARLLDVNTQVIKARRDGGLPVCRDASEIALWTC